MEKQTLCKCLPRTETLVGNTLASLPPVPAIPGAVGTSLCQVKQVQVAQKPGNYRLHTGSLHLDSQPLQIGQNNLQTPVTVSIPATFSPCSNHDKESTRLNKRSHPYSGVGSSSCL